MLLKYGLFFPVLDFFFFFNQTPLQYHRNIELPVGCETVVLLLYFYLISFSPFPFPSFNLCLLSNKSFFYKQNYPEDKSKKPDKQLSSVTTLPGSGVIKYYTHKIFWPKKSMYEIQKLLGFFQLRYPAPAKSFMYPCRFLGNINIQYQQNYT